MKQNLFTFTSLRSPAKAVMHNNMLFYVKDDLVRHVGEEVIRTNRNFAPNNDDLSMEPNHQEPYLGPTQFIYKRIFCEPRPELPLIQANIQLAHDLLNRYGYNAQVNCDGNSDLSFFDEFPYLIDTETDSFRIIINQPISNPLIKKLKHILKETLEFLTSHKKNALTNSDIIYLQDKITSILDLPSGNNIINFVYDDSGYQQIFKNAKAQFFDQLYYLYVLRRLKPIDLEPIHQILRTLNFIEALAINYGLINPPNSQRLNEILHSQSREKENFKIKSEKDILQILTKAVPVIHPLFGLLHFIKKPFNTLQPIGVADLKIVKSKLIGYKASDIASIQNVMKGEKLESSSRELQKNEDIFSFSTENNSSSQNESQSTGKNEIKKEIDEIIKNSINVNAGTQVSYKGSFIDAGITAGMAYNYSKDESIRSATSMASEIIDKAVSKIESKSIQNRSLNKTFEFETENKHSFDNSDAQADHVSGIYRWVDKIYEAQVYNYGKRLMYEFVVPEPAAFFVKSRLTNYGMFGLNCPEKPQKPVLEQLSIKNPNNPNSELLPANIDKNLFNKLSAQYDLEEFIYPEETKTALLLDKNTGKSYFSQFYGASKDAKFISDHYEADINALGYNIFQIQTSGYVRFWDQSSEAQLSPEKNRFALYLNGRQVIFKNMPLGGPLIEAIQSIADNINLNNALIPVVDGKVQVDIEVNDPDFYNLSVLAYLRINPDFLLAWQNKVFNKIKDVERDKINAINQENMLIYNAELSDYRNKMEALTLTKINDLLQGRQESYNNNLINTELKRSCISFLSNEFDAQSNDDLLLSFPYEAVVASEPITINYPKFKIDDKQCGFKEEQLNVTYPTIQLEEATRRGSFVQFMEQAFEWDKLSYICYPYFWADKPKWIEMMNREDIADPKMSAFLQAGSTRVLVAVHPAYNQAVLHFLATGQLWAGGESPVIGDPLFIPLFEEIKDAQDDLQNAKAEGKPYRYTLGTALTYLQDSSSPLPSTIDE